MATTWQNLLLPWTSAEFATIFLLLSGRGKMRYESGDSDCAVLHFPDFAGIGELIEQLSSPLTLPVSPDAEAAVLSVGEDLFASSAEASSAVLPFCLVVFLWLISL